jgi:hypothetical protein
MPTGRPVDAGRGSISFLPAPEGRAARARAMMEEAHVPSPLWTVNP